MRRDVVAKAWLGGVRCVVAAHDMVRRGINAPEMKLFVRAACRLIFAVSSQGNRMLRDNVSIKTCGKFYFIGIQS